jgi:glucokinase
MSRKKAVAGIDIGGTNTAFAIVDRKGNIIDEDMIKTSRYPRADEYVAALFGKIMQIYKKSEDDVELIGFGIGAPMGNINKGTIVSCKPPGRHNPLAELFAKHSD